MNKKVVLAACMAVLVCACQSKAPTSQPEQVKPAEQPSNDGQGCPAPEKRGCCESEKAQPACDKPAQAAQVVAPVRAEKQEAAQVAAPAPVEKLKAPQESQTASGSVVSEEKSE